MFFLTLMLACSYTVEDWWLDQADGFCTCNFPETYDDCLSQQLYGYESGEFYEVCYDDAAPVERSAVRAWYRDFTENCQRPAQEEPTPENPEWFQECEN